MLARWMPGGIVDSALRRNGGSAVWLRRRLAGLAMPATGG
jgi:hypothetical protein